MGQSRDCPNQIGTLSLDSAAATPKVPSTSGQWGGYATLELGLGGGNCSQKGLE